MREKVSRRGSALEQATEWSPVMHLNYVASLLIRRRLVLEIKVVESTHQTHAEISVINVLIDEYWASALLGRCRRRIPKKE